EAILDQLHGHGSFIPGEVAAKASEKSPAKPEEKTQATAGDDISEDEFESLLDELHGKGKAPVGPAEVATKTRIEQPAHKYNRNNITIQ
ncbi:MAG: hypothetical protein ACKO96_15925, partial [Flammeovirgaceae bacterium]